MLRRLLTFFSLFVILSTVTLSSNISSVYGQNISDWKSMNVPQAGTESNSHDDIEVISPNNIWAVGGVNNNGRAETLIQHWNGTSWSKITSPNTSDVSNSLTAVAARASNDIWAVGDHYNSTNDSFSSGTLMMHWDGNSWTITPGPYNNEKNSVYLRDVFIASQNDAWAVGSNNSGALLLRWNGQTWTEIVIPGVAIDSNLGSSLKSIHGTSPNDIWVVGSNNGEPLTTHWDGQAWSIVPNPPNPIDSFSGTLLSVVGFTENNYWALGSYYQAIDGYAVASLSMLHWDGSTWQTVPVPVMNSRMLGLNKLSGNGSNSLWISGKKGSTYSDWRPFIMHYDGQTWQEVPFPIATDEYTNVKSINVPNIQTAYAAISYVEGLTVKSAIMKYTQPVIIPTATSSPTQTPIPTVTPKPTATPTPVPNIAVTFANAKLTNLTKNSATITWITNTPTSTKAKYGTSSYSLTKLAPENTSRTSTHTVTLNNLISRKTHYIKFYGTNAAGKEYSSRTFSFRTL